MRRGRALLLAFAFSFAVPAAAAQPIFLVTLGDSLTQGDGDEAGGGYPTRLLKSLESDFPGSTLKNLGQSGWTSDDLINTQLQPAVSALNAAPADNSKVALVWIGSNDLFGLYNWVCDEDFRNDYAACESDGMRIFSDNIGTILASLKATGARLYIALLDDQSKRPVMTNSSLRSASFDKVTADDVLKMSAQTRKYNDVIRKAASTHGATTVDFFDTTIFENAATLSEDGNHPNGAGYAAIAEIWHRAITGSKPGD
jgi:lysophospholipase L1-like esterase